MARVTGLGGMFLRARDPAALTTWYAEHLGLSTSGGAAAFAAPPAEVTFAVFAADDTYFPPTQPVMLNLRVDDLDGLLERLQQDGVEVDPRRESYDFGRFGWCVDPEGNRVELWEPAGD